MPWLSSACGGPVRSLYTIEPEQDEENQEELDDTTMGWLFWVWIGLNIDEILADTDPAREEDSEENEGVEEGELENTVETEEANKEEGDGVSVFEDYEHMGEDGRILDENNAGGEETFKNELEEEQTNEQDDDEETSEPSDEDYATAEEEQEETEERKVDEDKKTEVKLWMGSIAKYNAPRSKIF